MDMVEFNGYSINCEPEDTGSGWWSIGVVTILDRDGKPVKTQWPPSFLNRSYPTRENACDAGISAGKKWTQGLYPDEEFI
jgi:hypothetical protein